MKFQYTLPLVLLASISVSIFANEATEQLLEQGQKRLENNQSSQLSINKAYDKQRQLEKLYLSEMKLLQGLNMYNELLKRQLDNQSTDISKLNTSINNATLIERQILPLLVRMVSALDKFVSIDTPFLLEEREKRVMDLKELIESSNLTTSEKTRRVFEAYQIENEFGYTIESYQGKVAIDDSKFAVEFLRIGRIALLYRDLGGERVGRWDSKNKQWHPLTESQYKRHIAKGLKIAKEEIAPELITIPLVANKENR